MKLQAIKVEYHRNGSSGEGFHAVAFYAARHRMIAAVFAEPGVVAILDPDTVTNCYRAEAFEPWLREQVAAYEAAQRKALGLEPL